MKTVNTNTYERDLPACVADNIQRLKKRQNLSFNDLANLVGATPSYLCRIAKGERRRVSYQILKNLADTFNVSIEELLGERSTKPEFSTEEQKHEIFLEMKNIISQSSLTHHQKIEQLRALADVCQYLLVKRF